MIAFIVGGLAQLFDDHWIGHVGGIAHAQIDDIHPGPALAVFQFIDLAEQIGRQSLDPVGHVDQKGGLGGVRFTLHGTLLEKLGPRNGRRGRPCAGDGILGV